MSGKPNEGLLAEIESSPKLDGRKWRLSTWFPDISESCLAALRIFHFELISFNGRMNLISPRTEAHADAAHFADCIYASRILLSHSDSRRIFDLGSGNGLPGLILAALDPGRELVLVDSDSRKVEFLKHAAHRMGLKNVQAIQSRVEDLEEGAIECAISRGFASVSKSIGYNRKAFVLGANYFHMKSEGWVKEVAEIPSQLCAVWAPKLCGEYNIPDSGPRFALIVTKKIG